MRFLSKEAIFVPAAVIISIVLLFADPFVISLAADTAVTPENTATSGSAVTTGSAVSSGAAISSGSAITTGSAVSSGSAITTGSAVSSGSAITTGSAVTSGSAITTGSAVTSGAAITTGSAIATTNAAISTTGAAIKADDESLWYNQKIPMKKDYQKLLWENCQEKKLDYIDMLALISVESNFNEKDKSGKCMGYFQISSGHFSKLSKLLKTPNKPLDGAVNIKWGTTMYSWALHDTRTKGLTGKKLRDVALSIYQRGTGGYDRYGINKKYLGVYYKKRDMVLSWFKK